jgi:predicted MFS family arabinose efflux permease
VIADVVHPTQRASATGIYRFWRDAGYVAGALFAGAIADRLDARWAIEAVAAVTLASAIVVLLCLPETHPAGRALRERARGIR